MALVGYDQRNNTGEAAWFPLGLTLTLCTTLVPTPVPVVGPVPYSCRSNSGSPSSSRSSGGYLTLTLTLTTRDDEEAPSAVAEVARVTQLLPESEPDGTSREDSGVAGGDKGRIAGGGKSGVARQESISSSWSRQRSRDCSWLKRRHNGWLWLTERERCYCGQTLTAGRGDTVDRRLKTLTGFSVDRPQRSQHYFVLRLHC